MDATVCDPKGAADGAISTGDRKGDVGAQRELMPTDLVWHEGAPAWMPLSSFHGGA